MKHGIDGGTPWRSDGTLGTLQAPLASTTVRQRKSPWLVAMWYPVSVCLTEVTAVCVRTGAADTMAKREMKSITSPIVM